MADDLNCPYCDKIFDSENDRGVHISENHVDPDTEITKPSRDHDPRKSIVDDWRGRAEVNASK